MFDRNYTKALEPATLSPWAYQLEYFSQQECDRIIELGLAINPVQGNLGSDNIIDDSVRRSTVGFFHPGNNDTDWIYKKIMQAVKTFNQQFWRFNLSFLECIQFTRYDRPGDFYRAHMDMFYDELEVRKLSISVQLSPPDQYKGSDLRILNNGNNFSCAPRDRGSIIVFPSYQVHEVSQLESGTRYSLVSWIAGPPFK